MSNSSHLIFYSQHSCVHNNDYNYCNHFYYCTCCTGPRCWTLREGPRRAALDALLSLSDVVLMTEEEAAAMTDTADPHAAAQWVLQRPGAATQWAVVKAGAAGALLYARGEGGAGAFEAQAYQVAGG